MTPWLTVMGKGLDGMPLIEMQLRRAGDELTGVRAWVSKHSVQPGSTAQQPGAGSGAQSHAADC